VLMREGKTGLAKKTVPKKTVSSLLALIAPIRMGGFISRAADIRDQHAFKNFVLKIYSSLGDDEALSGTWWR
jgi:hypothetical protein